VLIVEDDALVALDLEERLGEMGHVVVGVCADGREALRLCEDRRPDLVLMDIRLPGELDGVETACRLAERSDVPVVFVTDNADDATLRRATDARPFGLLFKPFDLRELRAVVATATQRSRAERERQSSEQKMFETQKLESLGALAGGIAHDFNNLLTVVLGNVALARADHADGASTAESLIEIEAAARKAAELCQQMLAYAGKATLIESEFDLSALARETAELLRASVSKKALQRLELGSDLPRVHADRAQLQQVLVNLVVNASEAMGDVGGTITVRTDLARPSEADLRAAAVAPAVLEPVDYVSLEVHDTGHGIEPAAFSRIFEPFFSTKGAGRGLGLAAVAGIARRHRGVLGVTSSAEAGTSFSLLLPATGTSVRRSSSRRMPAARSASDALTAPGALVAALDARVVLVVDDEEGVVRVVRRLLGALGLETLAACDGRQALERLGEDGGGERRICLVVLDLTMPGLDGVETLGRIRAEHPELPVLLTSGYTAASTELRVRFDAKTRFLQKPFSVAELREAIDALLR
jgi:signal transduction histidine kinase